MMKTNKSVWLCCAVLALAACECEQRTNQRAPKIEILDADGNERTLVDFGQVQVAVTGEQKLRIRNGGTVALTLSGATFTDPKFGVATTLPTSVSASGELELVLTFTPVDPDIRVTGTVTLATDDPNRPTVDVSLAGKGIAAVAVPTPSTLNFAEVYLNESKGLNLTLTNVGSNALTVESASFTGAVPATLTGDLAALQTTIAAGQGVTTLLTYAPTQLEAVGGQVELVLSGGLGTVSVPLAGKSIEARPKLCFKFDQSATEQCTDVTTTFLPIVEGSLCDTRLYPPDGGANPCVALDGGPVPSQKSAKVYFRNEGNTPISYSVRFETQVGAKCDGGSDQDFLFSNAPLQADGGPQTTWTEATVQVPASVNDPLPWETAPLSVIYRPTSRCRQDSADQARVLWTRQGEPGGTNRQPQTLILNLTGTSMLPRGVQQDITCQGTIPCAINFLGVANAGDAPLTVTGVTLWKADYIPLPDGGITRGDEPFEQCVASSTDDCAMFSWAPGQDPNTSLPTTLAGTVSPSQPVSRVLGQIVFGALDAGASPLQNREYRVFAVIGTNDPYQAQVISDIKGTYR